MAQCQAITIIGDQCSRNAVPGSKYCWQHQNYEEVLNPRYSAPLDRPYLDVPKLETFTTFYSKQRLPEEERDMIIAKGPLTIGIESTKYINLPFSIQVGSGYYTYQNIIDLITATFDHHLDVNVLEDLIRQEEEKEATGVPSKVSKARSRRRILYVINGSI